MSEALRRRFRRTRVARLATVDPRGQPHLVPVCFAWEAGVFYTAVDRKPKTRTQLARVRNIEANPNVSLLLDEYSDDWSRLWFIQVRGRARLLRRGKEHDRARRLLRKKYRQYAAGMLPEHAPVIRIVPRRVISWGKL